MAIVPHQEADVNAPPPEGIPRAGVVWVCDPRYCSCPVLGTVRRPWNEGAVLDGMMGLVQVLPGRPACWSPVVSVGLCSSAAGAAPKAWCTRKASRQSGLILDGQARTAVRIGQAAARNCGTKFRAWRRVDTSGTDLAEVRMVAKTLCGCRLHRDCDKKMREKQRARMQGPWTKWVALTYSSTGRSILEDSRSVHRWIRAFTKELNDEARKGDTENLRVTQHVKDERESAKNDPKRKGRLPSLFQYAWVIENHKSGFPHVHMCMAVDWIDYEWAKQLWSRIVGAATGATEFDDVYSIGGVCHYLSTYLSKGGITNDLLGVWRRRRLWATTRKRPETPEPLWTPEEGDKQEPLEEQVKDAKAWGEEDGWSREYGRDGVYAVWRRPIGSRPAAPRELDEDEAQELMQCFDERERKKGVIARPKKRKPPEPGEGDRLKARLLELAGCLTPSVKVC